MSLPRLLLLRCLCALLALSPSPPASETGDGPLKIKLATVAPKGSSYYKLLQTMSEEWKQAPGGGAQLVIYGDGTQGSETDVVKKMRTGVLAAGLLTAPGINSIEPAVSGLQSIPMMFRDFDEVEYVGRHLQPKLEQMLLAKGFVVLFWTDAGYVRFFTREPMVHPQELKSRKLFSWSGSPEQTDLWQKEGYRPVALEVPDILPGFQTGLVDTISITPFYALAIQLDKPAPYMLDLNWAPLVGACVVTKKVWDSVPEASRESMLKSARTAGVETTARGRRESVEAVAAMEKRGLTVQRVSPELRQEWIAAAEKHYPMIRTHIVPTDTFDEVSALLSAYRKTSRADASGK